MGGLSIWHWLILLVVLGIVFGGTKRFRNIGEDLGSAIKSFRKGLADPDDKAQLKADPPAQPASTESKSEQVK